MANTIEFEDNYSGEVLDKILQLTMKRNETYQLGLIHMETDVTHTLFLPTSSLSGVVQDNVATPDIKLGEAHDGINEYKITERKLTPEPFMIFYKWDPEKTRSLWKQFKPQGNLIFRELSPIIQADIVSKILEEKNYYIGQAIWRSVKGGTTGTKTVTPAGEVGLGIPVNGNKYHYFDGAIERIAQSKTATKPLDKANIVGTSLLETGKAVEDALKAIYKAVKPEMRASIRQNKFAMSHQSWMLYDEYLTAKEVKYTDNSRENVRYYKGVEIVPVDGITEHTIILSKFSKGIDGNLWGAIDWSAPKDEDAFKIGNIAEYSTEKFFQMRLKMDVNWVRMTEVYAHSAYLGEG